MALKKEDKEKRENEAKMKEQQKKLNKIGMITCNQRRLCSLRWTRRCWRPPLLKLKRAEPLPTPSWRIPLEHQED